MLLVTQVSAAELAQEASVKAMRWPFAYPVPAYTAGEMEPTFLSIFQSQVSRSKECELLGSISLAAHTDCPREES
jgi:hypothetical protein